MAVFCVTFLGVFVVLTGVMPTSLMASSYDGRNVNLPNEGYFDFLDVVYYADSVLLTVDDGSFLYGYYTQSIGIGNWDTEILSNYDISRIYVRGWYYALGMRWSPFHLDWYDETGKPIGEEYLGVNYVSNDTLEDLYDEYGTIQGRVQCDYYQMVYAFDWNTTLYSGPSEAWANDDLYVLFCIGFDNVHTTGNVWEIVGGLLFFQQPDVHWIINVLVAIPLYTCIAILLYLLIIKAIPLLGG